LPWLLRYIQHEGQAWTWSSACRRSMKGCAWPRKTALQTSAPANRSSA